MKNIRKKSWLMASLSGIILGLIVGDEFLTYVVDRLLRLYQQTSISQSTTVLEIYNFLHVRVLIFFALFFWMVTICAGVIIDKVFNHHE